MEIVTSIGGKVADYLFVAAGNQLGYLFYYNDNIQNLKNQVKNLADSRDMVQKKIEFAERHGEIIFANVRSWIAEVGNISAKAERFLEDEDKANKRCLKGWCINLGQHYRFSKEAKKQTLAISEQLQEVGQIDSVSSPAPPSGIISSSEVFSSGSFESRNSIKKKIVKALVDDVGVYKIGICGMGGVGKTTLVKEIGKHLKYEKIYDTVVMAVVSQTPSIMKIQGEIADMLGVTTSLPANSEIERASFLQGRIKERKQILVILDDVWERIELNSIGIPYGNDHCGCKIVITSRSKIVCNKMTCQQIFTVETLSKQESWALFKALSGMVIETSDTNQTARDVAIKCGGLPIAIVTVAGALKGKNKHVWRNAARQLQKSKPIDIPGMEGNVISSLELSFNYLENMESKLLFLLCSLFPEDYRISFEDLVRYWIGLRWFGDTDDTIEEVRDRVHAIVSTITSYFLLINDGEKYIKMHDVVRDFAITIAPKYNHKFMVKAGIGLKVWPNKDKFEDSTCISLMANNIRELPNGLECPKLQVLLLQHNFGLDVPNNFFQCMKNLNVLDLSSTILWSLPESLSFLSTIRTLNLSSCRLGDLSVIGNLSKLEILSLCHSNIKEIPVSFSRLNNLKLFDLNGCWELTLIPYGVIPSFKKLEELYINSFTQWESDNENLRSNVKLFELQTLARLTSLEISIPNLSPKLSLNELSNFKLIIGYDPSKNRYWDDGGYSRVIELTKTNVPIKNDWVKSLLKRTKCLTLEKITNLKSISHNLVEEGLAFNKLKYLGISSCGEIKYLLDTSKGTPNSTFHNLEHLLIYENPTLVQLCNGQLPSQSFYKLKVLQVKWSKDMLNVVPSDLLQHLQNLQTLQASYCRSLVYIFDCDKIKIAKEEAKLLSSLEYLSLQSLSDMSHIWNGDHQSICLHKLKRVKLLSCHKLIKLFSPTLLQSLICLEGIDIRYCSNLEEIFEKKKALGQELDHNITSPSLENLTSINISHCDKLKNLFTPSIVKCLVKLKHLQLWDCSTIQDIITNEIGEKEASIEFPSLYEMNIGDLGSLTCFSSWKGTVKFPTLERLNIRGCPKMQTFGYGKQVTPKLNKVLLKDKLRWKDNLNTTVQEFFREQGERRRRR